MVIEEHLEVGREGGLDDGWIGQSPCPELSGGQPVVGGDHFVRGFLQSGPARDQGTQMALVRGGVLRLLPQMRTGLLGHLRMPHQRDCLVRRVDDELLETRCEEGDHVALHSRRRSFRLPVERDGFTCEVKPDPAESGGLSSSPTPSCSHERHVIDGIRPIGERQYVDDFVVWSERRLSAFGSIFWKSGTTTDCGAKSSYEPKLSVTLLAKSTGVPAAGDWLITLLRC